MQVVTFYLYFLVFNITLLYTSRLYDKYKATIIICTVPGRFGLIKTFLNGICNGALVMGPWMQPTIYFSWSQMATGRSYKSRLSFILTLKPASRED